MHPTPTPTPAASLPLCLPTSYRDQAGRCCMAYPRSPWNAARYLVIRCGAGATDLECVHDDFGHLIPLRQRTFGADWASHASWGPVQ